MMKKQPRRARTSEEEENKSLKRITIESAMNVTGIKVVLSAISQGIRIGFRAVSKKSTLSSLKLT